MAVVRRRSTSEPADPQSEDGSRPKKIGIISEMSHAKPVVIRLERAGYQVLSLGGSPTSLPPTLDCIVLRLKSCSHEASYLAHAVSRAKGLPLIIENGVGAILRAVDELMKGEKPKSVIPEIPESDINQAEEDKDMHDDFNDDFIPDDADSKSCREVMLRAIQAGGMYFIKMTELTPKNVTDAATAMGLVVGAKARVRAQTEYELIGNYAERTLVKAFRKLSKESDNLGLHRSFLYYQGKNSRGMYSFPVLSRAALDPNQLEILARMNGYLTRPVPFTHATVNNEEDRTHFHSKHHRSHYVAKDKRWRINDNKNSYIVQVRTRAEAAAKMEELDARFEQSRARQQQQQEQAEVEVSPVIEAAQVIEVVPEPIPELEPEPSPVDEVVKVEVVKVEVIKTPEEQLAELLERARELMTKHNLPRTYQASGIRAQLMFVHLAMPPQLGGCTVTEQGEIQTKDITKVTCEHCKTTDFYQFASWSVANLTIGD